MVQQGSVAADAGTGFRVAAIEAGRQIHANAGFLLGIGRREYICRKRPYNWRRRLIADAGFAHQQRNRKRRKKNQGVEAYLDKAFVEIALLLGYCGKI
jgi:hypothetical protein